MKRIKDFLYNWNDIVIIILIILAAAALITWRVNKIMEYPSTLVNNVTDADATDSESPEDNADSATDAEATDAEKTDGEDADAEATSTDGDDANGEATDDNGEATDAENTDSESTDANAESQTTETQETNTYIEPGSGPRDSDIWENGHLKSSVTVTTAQGTAYDAVDSLIAAGLFTSFDDYFAVCMRVGVDSSRIQAATFTFDAGQTQEDIVKQVTM